MSTTLIVAAAILVWSVLGIGVCLFLAGARRADAGMTQQEMLLSVTRTFDAPHRVNLKTSADQSIIYGCQSAFSIDPRWRCGASDADVRLPQVCTTTRSVTLSELWSV